MPFYKKKRTERYRCKSRASYGIESAELVRWLQSEKKEVVSCTRRDLPDGGCEAVVEYWKTMYFPDEDD